MTKPKIFITQPIEESALQRLRKVMNVEIHSDSSRTISKEDRIKGVSRNDYLFCRVGDIDDVEVIAASGPQGPRISYENPLLFPEALSRNRNPSWRRLHLP